MHRGWRSWWLLLVVVDRGSVNNAVLALLRWRG
ncbi:hypothetical protein Ae505Ps2_6269c [Pseudonocardia sp. Ae505_Ps2]|nr:hypothetical protein Ae505Ps2_6286c [Pseudonocardia sp. Ae505_Ps2]OLM08263.1 hypothetical protein Ae505Ps2_6269c [Pseudonocardia sp. Ae505_Ps2]